jgi:hypothetical protein
MKTLLTLLVLLALPALADTPAAAGPLGGRLLALDNNQKAELVIAPDRTVTVAFHDDALKPVAPSGQVVTATADAPSGKVKLEFKPEGNVLKSTAPLPEGENYLIVAQIRSSADAKPKNFRITYDMNVCGGCQRPEYACTCAH